MSPDLKFSRCHEATIIVVNIDFAPSPLHHYNLGRTADVSFLRAMLVPGYLVPSWMNDAADL